MIDIDSLPDDMLNSKLKNLGREPGLNYDKLVELQSRVAKMTVDDFMGFMGNCSVVTLLKTIDALRDCDTASGTTAKNEQPTKGV